MSLRIVRHLGRYYSRSNLSPISTPRATAPRPFFVSCASIQHVFPPSAFATRCFATDDFKKKKKKKTRKSPGNVNAKDGRIIAKQESKVSKSKKASSRLCVGCGVEVVRSNSGRSNDDGDGDGVGMIGGKEAVEGSSLSKKQQKKLRYVDVTTDKGQSTFLCDRCKALKSDNVWKAYDALYDVAPEVFSKQLQHIVGRRRFGLCILVVDSTDPEHSAMKNLRKCIGKVPCILVFTKTDLVPRMNHGDQKMLLRRVSRNTGAHFVESFAVSSVTGKGIFELAESILRQLQGRDVFVVGSANVGKSTLVQKLATIIADSVYMKGKSGKRRRDLASNVPITGSHLPGTTLQAVRIPCFSTPGNALWDTPGIINAKAIQYGLFPSHLMEPLARPREIPVPTQHNELQGQVLAGETLLIEADWMEEGEDEEPCVLARLDIVDTGRGNSVFTRSFLHPSLRVRLVPTERAPNHATIPRSFIQRVNQRIRNKKLEDEYSIPLKPFITKDLPEGKFIPCETEWNEGSQRYFMDVSFASLGWISVAHDGKFSVIPHCVEGSVFSKRRSLYPMNLREGQEDDTAEGVQLDKETIQRRLRDAARTGRHQNKRAYSHSRSDFDDVDDDYWY